MSPRLRLVLCGNRTLRLDELDAVVTDATHAHAHVHADVDGKHAAGVDLRIAG